MTKTFLYISNPIYPFTFYIFLNYNNLSKIKEKIKIDCEKTIKKVYRKIDKIKLHKSDGYCFEVGGCIFIIIKKFNGTPLCYDALHHEITHAVDFSGCYIGIKQTKRVREYSAYLHGFITNQIYQKIL